MSRPTFVKFARLGGTPKAAYDRLVDTLFGPLQLTPGEFVPLRTSSDPWEYGLVEAGPRTPCDDFESLLAEVETATLFGSTHLAPYIPGSIYFHIFDVDEEGFSATASFDGSMMTWENENFEMGQWVKAMLTLATAGLGASVCGYGKDPDYEVDYASIDPQRVLSRLRSGDLLDIWYPTFHAISTTLIDTAEIEGLMRRRTPTLATQDLCYEESSLGYHLLHILP